MKRHRFSFVTEVDSLIIRSKYDIAGQKMKWSREDFDLEDWSGNVREVGFLSMVDLQSAIGFPGVFNLIGNAVIHRLPSYSRYTETSLSKSDIQLPLSKREVEKLIVLEPLANGFHLFFDFDKEYFYLYNDDIFAIKIPNPVYDIEEILEIGRKYLHKPVQATIFMIVHDFKSKLFNLKKTDLSSEVTPVAIETSLPWKMNDTIYYLNTICVNKNTVYGIETKNGIILFEGGEHEDR